MSQSRNVRRRLRKQIQRFYIRTVVFASLLIQDLIFCESSVPHLSRVPFLEYFIMMIRMCLRCCAIAYQA